LLADKVPGKYAAARTFEVLNDYNTRGDFRMTSLASKTCVPCRGGAPPLKGKELEALHQQVPQWKVVNEHHITRSFTFPDFKQALDFVNRVGAVAEAQGHHPDILLAWGKAEITLWTHKIDGLTESDFIMAAKIDDLLAS
jgi:4a-hydroxytetrahydrobiopterin dehydratase